MENLDFKLRRIYEEFEKEEKYPDRIHDNHARQMTQLSIHSMFNTFKIFFADDLKRLGLETEMKLRVPERKQA